MTKHINSQVLDDVCTIEEFAKRYPYLHFTRERFDYLLREKDTNGMIESGCIVKLGRRYAVRSNAFRDWYNRYININGRD